MRKREIREILDQLIKLNLGGDCCDIIERKGYIAAPAHLLGVDWKNKVSLLRSIGFSGPDHMLTIDYELEGEKQMKWSEGKKECFVKALHNFDGGLYPYREEKNR